MLDEDTGWYYPDSFMLRGGSASDKESAGIFAFEDYYVEDTISDYYGFRPTIVLRSAAGQSSVIPTVEITASIKHFLLRSRRSSDLT